MREQIAPGRFSSPKNGLDPRLDGYIIHTYKLFPRSDRAKALGNNALDLRMRDI